jgi:acyl carrier protein
MVNDFTQAQLTTQIEELVREHVGSSTPIPLDADLINDLGMDSLELVELSLKLEKQLGVKFSIADIRRCATLDDVIQLASQVIQDQSQGKAERV